MVKKNVNDTNRTKQIADQAVALAEYGAKALVAAEHLRIKTKNVERLPLEDDERATVASLPALPPKIKKKLAKKDGSFTVADVAGILIAAAEFFIGRGKAADFPFDDRQKVDGLPCGQYH